MKGRTQTRRARWLRVALVVTVGLAVHALGGSAQAAPAPTGSDTLAGLTSQRFPVFFKVSSDGKVLMASGIAIRMNCTSGGQVVVPDGFGHIPIAANGRLHASFTPPTTTQNGVTYSTTDTLRARLGGSQSNLTGTWRLTLHVTMASGQSTACDSGPVHFSATS